MCIYFLVDLLSSPGVVKRASVILILETSKQSDLQEVKRLAQGHIAREWWNPMHKPRAPNSGLLIFLGHCSALPPREEILCLPVSIPPPISLPSPDAPSHLFSNTYSSFSCLCRWTPGWCELSTPSWWWGPYLPRQGPELRGALLLEQLGE